MLEFDPINHIYKYNGRVIPSVTGILKGVGIIDDRFYNEEACKRGSKVHLATQLLDEDDLDEDSIDDDIRPYLDAWKKFKYDTGFIPDKIEAQVMSEAYYYAGTLDRTGKFRRPNKSLLDIKTIKTRGAIAKWVRLQIAGYRYCLEEPHDGLVVQLCGNGTYRAESFEDPNDIKTFLCAAVTYNWKLENGGLL